MDHQNSNSHNDYQYNYNNNNNSQNSIPNQLNAVGVNNQPTSNHINQVVYTSKL